MKVIMHLLKKNNTYESDYAPSLRNNNTIIETKGLRTLETLKL